MNKENFGKDLQRAFEKLDDAAKKWNEAAAEAYVVAKQDGARLVELALHEMITRYCPEVSHREIIERGEALEKQSNNPS